MSQIQDSNSDVEVNAASPPTVPKRKKSRKLSRAEKKQAKLALKDAEKTKAPLATRISSDSTHSFDFYKTTDVHNLSDISSVDTPRPSVDLTNNPTLDLPKQCTDAPRPESIIDKQFSFLNHTGGGGNQDHTSKLSVGKSHKQQKVGRDMSRHHQYQKKSVKADALLKKLEGSLMLHGKENGVIHELNENDDDDEMVSPLKQRSSQICIHSGEVKTHQQLDREGQVITPKYSQYSLPANVKKRSSILTDISYERSTLPSMGKSPQSHEMHLPEYDSEFSESNSQSNNGHDDNKSDGKEEQDGNEEANSKDNGDVTPPRVTYPPPIIDASLPDLETEITTPPPFYKPPLEESMAELAATRNSVVTPPTTPTRFKSSTVTESPPVVEESPVVEEPPVIEEPSPPKKQRKPWRGMC